jgi:outer membrane protein TolC
VATEGLKQAERNVIYAMRTFSQYQRQFAVDVVSEYFRLLQDKDQVRNAYGDYTNRLETIRFSEARGLAGIEKQVAVDEARSDEQNAKNSYIFEVTNYRNNLDRFKLVLGLPLATQIDLDDGALEEVKELGLKELLLPEDAAFDIALARQLELLNDIDRFEDSKRKIVVAANRLKADLNIFGDAALSSEGPTDYTEFDINDIRAGVGIELDLPLDRLRERNDYRATLINFEAAIRDLSLALDNKKDEIDRGMRNLESLRRSYAIRTNSVAIAQRRVAGEQLSLKAGRRTVRDISEAQDALLDSQNQVTNDLVTHLTAKLQFLLDVGILDTDLDNFWIRDDAVLLPESISAAAPEAGGDGGEILRPEEIFRL